MWKWMQGWRGRASAAPDATTPGASAAPTAPPPTEAAGGMRAEQTRVGNQARREQQAETVRVPAQQLFSLEAMQRAWLAVKRAGGGAGMDGVTITQFEANLTRELRELQRLLASGEYRPKPVRQVWVPKTRGGLRPLALWALRDRVAQRAVYELLAPVFEPHFLPCSFGFRPGLGVQDAVAALQRQRDTGLRWVVDADIEDCFGAIPTDRLMALIVAPRPRPAAAALCARLAGGRHHEQCGWATAPGGNQSGQCVVAAAGERLSASSRCADDA
jgi:hypothetical protein